MSDEHNPESAREQAVNRIIAAYLEAERAGQPPDREELLRRHPEVADELRAFFADQDRFRGTAGLLGPAASPAGEATAPAAGEVDALALGNTVRYFGDYELLAEVGRGGMGIVYKARQTSLNRVVALKMILAGHLASPEEAQRFHTEAEAAASLDHPHIVPIHEIGQHEGRHYFSMKLVEGGNLVRHLPSFRNDQRAALLVATVARAVQHAHERGILHRDLKPANILLEQRTGDGAASVPYVTDFGLAKRVAGGQGQTQSGAIVGTPGYMAPEQARGVRGLTTAADVYSLGAILYELLTGRPPFSGQTPYEVLVRLLEEEPERPRALEPQIDRDLEIICLKCLQKEPAKRYASAAALADDLQRFLDGEPIQARAVGQAERAWRWCRRNPVVAGLLAAVAATLLLGATVAAGLAVWALRERDRADQNATAATAEARKAREEEQQKDRQLTRAEWLVYAAQLERARQFWEQGNVVAARDLLDSARWDYRGWEHRYLHTLFNASHLNLPRAHGRGAQCGLQPRRQPPGERLLGYHHQGMGCVEWPADLRPEGARGTCEQRGFQPRRQTHCQWLRGPVHPR
jgi:tRNA A-37 threonylcarbamoyl transferase component Bud32